MSFDTLLGNDALKLRLSAACAHGKLSHSYLICGPAGSGRHTLSRLLAAALQCTGTHVPCGHCSACRKVFAGIHPDVITVDDADHKNLPVELVRTMRADVFVRPNEGLRKVYCIPRAQDLGIPSQNALLKVMEEPPEYAVFLLLTDNADKLLPTIRSRCAELNLAPLPEPVLLAALRQRTPGLPDSAYEAAALQSGGFLGQALELLSDSHTISERTAQFAAAFASGDRLQLTQLLVPMEKYTRDDFLQELRQWTVLLQQALRVRAGLPGISALCSQISQGRTAADILHAIRVLQQTQDYAQSNVGVGHLCGALRVQL